MTLKVIQLLGVLQKDFVERLYNISHGFKRHSASRGPSATAEFVVSRTIALGIGQKKLVRTRRRRR